MAIFINSAIIVLAACEVIQDLTEKRLAFLI